MSNAVSVAPSRTEWFQDARFGMFIHWGVYSVPARGEWVRSHEQISFEDYEPFVEAFDPQNADFDAWADAAKDAGMQYAVFTAKHHDGYAMFDSAFSDYTSAKHKPGRDFVAEFVTAFRARGIRVGLYFSLIDWSRPDYPVYEDEFHPMRGNPAYADHQPDFEGYLDFMHAQIREICTNYGSLDLLWFDFAYGDLRGEAWRGSELVAMVRSLQPNVIIDNRLETSADAFGSLVSAQPTPFSGDFVAPEQLVPAEGIVDVTGRPVPWEACITLNNSWGYTEGDELFKSSRTVIRQLVACVAKGGNLLLNVGPDADGVIPSGSLDVLREVGAWLRVNGEGVYGCTAAGIAKPEWGWFTKPRDPDDTRLFAHVLEQPIGPLALTGIDPERVATVRGIAGGTARRADSWLIEAYPDTAFVSLGPNDAFTYPLQDDADTVIEIGLRP